MSSSYVGLLGNVSIIKDKVALSGRSGLRLSSFLSKDNETDDGEFPKKYLKYIVTRFLIREGYTVSYQTSSIPLSEGDITQENIYDLVSLIIR